MDGRFLFPITLYRPCDIQLFVCVLFFLSFFDKYEHAQPYTDIANACTCHGRANLGKLFKNQLKLADL